MYSGLLIGKEIEVLSALDKSLIKKKGLVVDETKNLLIMRSMNGRQLKLPKSIVTLNVYDNKSRESFMINGSKLVGSPDERIKG